jgi:RNA polymerase sigma-70 factor (ECF subfamily)
MKAGPMLDALRDHPAPTDRCLELTEARTRHVLRTAEVRASLLVANSKYSRDQWEDIRQELIVDLLRRSPKFDPNRGEWEGFVRGVMRNHSTVLRQRKCREVVSPMSMEFIQARATEAGPSPTAALTSNLRCKGTIGLDVKLDLQRAISSMPLALQTLARQLSQMNVTEVCRSTGRSRSRVYQMIRQIRALLVSAGIQPQVHRPKAERGSPRHHRGADEFSSRNLVQEPPSSFTHFGALPERGQVGTSFVCSEEIQ